MYMINGINEIIIIIIIIGADQGSIDIIPQNMEKYISFSKTIFVDKRRDGETYLDKNVFVKLRFLDSLRFMSSSLDKLQQQSKQRSTHKY